MSLFGKYSFLYIAIFETLAFGLLSSSLRAGPVYWSKWFNEKTGCCIDLIGDNHGTYLQEVNPDIEMAQTFQEALKKLDKNCLVLVEDEGSELAFTAEDIMNDYNIHVGNDRFLDLISCSNLKKLALPKVCVKNIDHREERNALEAILNFHKIYNIGLEREALEDDEGTLVSIKLHLRMVKDFMSKIIAHLELLNGKNISIPTLLKKPLKLIDGLAATTENQALRNIFQDIANKMVARNNLLWNTFLRFGFSLQELEELTIQKLMEMTSNDMRAQDKTSYDKYAKMCEVLSGIMTSFDVEIVDAKALWQIDKSMQTYKKMVVVAGAEHIRNLEQHLLALGYEKVKCIGEGYNRKQEEIGYSYDRTLCDDGRCNIEDFNTCGNFVIKLDTYFSNKRLSKKALELAKKFIELSDSPPPLIPIKTFDWLTEDL